MGIHTSSLPKIGVGALIVNEKKQVLLVLRTREPEANTWSIPGGKIDPFESLHTAIYREIKEEVGIEIIDEELLCTAETIRPDLEQHWVSVIYLVEKYRGEAKNMEPTVLADMKWFSLDEIPENLACFTVPAINEYKKRLGK